MSIQMGASCCRKLRGHQQELQSRNTDLTSNGSGMQRVACVVEHRLRTSGVHHAKDPETPETTLTTTRERHRAPHLNLKPQHRAKNQFD